MSDLVGITFPMGIVSGFGRFCCFSLVSSCSGVEFGGLLVFACLFVWLSDFGCLNGNLFGVGE